MYSYLCTNGSYRPLLVASLLLALGCPGDDSTTTVGAPTTDSPSDTTAAMNDTTASPASGTAGSSSGAIDCGDAMDEASCGAAQNLAEGGGCTWMVINQLTIEDGACNFTTTERGACVGTDGLDDGCTNGTLCDSGDVGAYYRDVGGGMWEMAQGSICRGISGFMQCNDTLDEPCTCACEIPG